MGQSPTIDFNILKVFQNQSVVTASRSIGTVFQNLTGRPMLVQVTLSINFSGGNSGQANALTDTSNPPVTVVAHLLNGNTGQLTFELKFLVLPNNFYEVTTVTGTVSLVSWSEWT